MTTEDDFQRQLDAHPDDWQTRLVFADWLDERGDPRASGYRAMGVQRHHPGRTKAFPCWWSHQGCNAIEAHNRPGMLPGDWFLAVRTHETHEWWEDYQNRRDAEDAAALAFAELPARRRAELLAVGAA